MKTRLVCILTVCLALYAQAEESFAPWLVSPRNIVEKTEAGCPSFPSPAYNSLVYNTGCIPWDLEWSGAMSGDVNGATYQWYRYPEGSSQSAAKPCEWQTDHSTHEGFKPATDENNSRYIYFCKVTTPNCPSGVNSATFTVVVGSANDPCLTLTGTSFTISGAGSYTSGQTVTISATTSAYGGDHVYTWYHNGVEMDTTDHSGHYEFIWGFNNPKLVIHNVTPEDGGTYSVMMQDGSECFMYTDPVRVLVDNPACGPVPTLAVQKTEMAEGEANQTGVASNTLADGEIGQLIYMVQPEGSNPSTSVGTWTTDQPGLYQFKYVVVNPDNPSCFRESKVVTVRVIACGPTPTITPDADLIKINGTVHFTTTGLSDYETGVITFSKDGGAGGNGIYPANAHTCYQSGTYTYTYTITNSKAPGCNRTATCQVVWYSCGWVTARFNNWVADKIKLGNSINLGPAVPTETGMIGVLTVSKDGGTPVVIPTSSTYTPTEPGTYVFHYEVKHSDPRVTDCNSEIDKTIVVEPCGTTATLTTNKEVLSVGESATLTMSAKASGETASLTVSKDGGPSQTINSQQSTVNYTPTEAGVYVFTYTITTSGCGSNSQSVTIRVYDCGPEASVTATPNPVRVGQPITLTLSALGSDESATLTVSQNGGTAQTINYQLSTVNYTPTSVGTYTFTYTITHAYINCTRSAQATVQVLDCDADVTVSADKTVAAVGESVGITLSRTANSRETASLTYTVNGGSAQTINSQLSTINYTPTAPGVYEITYTLTDAVLGCETTDKTTFTVYDCGPEASVAASRTIVRTDDEIIITVSVPGANESGILTVSKNGGTPQPVAAGTWSASEEGTYTFTYTITHAYINCTRSAQVVVGVSDCGDPVMLTADKSVYSLGETVTFSLSRSATADETPSFTISKDGGTPQTLNSQLSTINYQLSTINYTPTEAGTYTAVYTLKNAVLGCETNGEVTFKVYECGPEVSVALDHNVIRLGESVALTLSALGAEETATLTVSHNGGTATTINSQLSTINYTPTELGEYTFTYSITHPYIDCARSATATLTVYDCGTPADISTDHTALKLGESAALTLSAVLPVETATLTVSHNGGTPTTINSQLSTVNYTPTEAGEYVFTYTVAHNAIDCETSDQVTIRVYDCGPEAEITIPVTELKLLRTTTITLSEPGTDESATLTVSVNGGPAQTINYQLSTINYTASELGDHVFTYTITHPYIDCQRTASFTLHVVEAELVFDDSNQTHLWSDPKNWWPAYNRIPNASDSAIIRQSCMVDISDAQTYDLRLDLAGTALTIRPTGGLLVRHDLMGVTDQSLVIQSDANGNGALVLGESNTDIPATVHFYSRAANMEELYPTWQYIGYPLRQPSLISAAYPKAMCYEWTNTPNKKTGGNWQRVDSLAGSVAPFTGYCITQSVAQTYTLHGKLNDPVRRTIDIPYNDQGSYPGFAFVANSWVAPIDIASLEAADFGAADATVYIMNAGSYDEALQQQNMASAQATGTARGQYNTIPVHAASYLPNALTVIPPMQGFFVHTRQATTLNLDYTKAVYTPSLTGIRTTPTRAPQSGNPSPVTDNPSVLRLAVSGFGAEDEVYILSGREFSTSFDNGWDGYKARSERSSIALAVQSADGPLAVAAVPELENTELTFDGNNHKTYTVKFEVIVPPAGKEIINHNFEMASHLYLLDTENGEMTPLTDGASYSFKCGPAPRKFRIVGLNGDIDNDRSNDQKADAEKFIYNGILYIRHANRLYNATGELLHTEE